MRWKSEEESVSKKWVRVKKGKRIDACCVDIWNWMEDMWVVEERNKEKKEKRDEWVNDWVWKKRVK